MSANYKFDPEKVTYFASTNSRGKRVAFGIKAKDRLQHIYVIGKTGMGKSTMLENMAIQDILNDEGVCFIDPHGSSAERLLKYIPKHRIKDTLYFAPFDSDYPVAFNILEDVGFDRRHLVVSGIMSIFKRIWKDAWSSRMEYILQNTLLALLEYPNTTLLDVNRMLSNPEFRRDVLANISDPVVKRFWAEEFAGYSDRYAQEATPAVQNKIGQFISNPIVRNIVGQSRSSFDLREFMDERKILIVNLSKGKLGELNAELLGSLLTVKLYLEAVSRSEQVEDNLAPFYTYVDEFQSMVNDSFADILSEARKYRLSLTLAHQYIEQLPDTVRAAVFGNVGTTVSFRVGPKDAEILEPIFAPAFKAQDISSLAQSEIYLTLLIDGAASPPFSARTLAPIEDAPYDFSEEIIKESRKQFARSREGVEEFIFEIDKKRGAANLDNLSKAQNGAPAQGKSQEAIDEHSSVSDSQSKARFDDKKNQPPSLAEILKKEYEKEPQGIKGPKDLQKDGTSKTKKDRKQLKALLDKVLNMQSEGQVRHKEQTKDIAEQTVVENKDAEALSSVLPDKSASKESVLERASKLLDSLKRKGEKEVALKAESQGVPSDTADTIAPESKIRDESPEQNIVSASFELGADKQAGVTGADMQEDRVTQSKTNIQETKLNMADNQMGDNIQNHDSLSDTQEFNMQNNDTFDSSLGNTTVSEQTKKGGNSKTQEELESILAGTDKLSDEELKELLENLLKDDLEK